MCPVRSVTYVSGRSLISYETRGEVGAECAKQIAHGFQSPSSELKVLHQSVTSLAWVPNIIVLS
jgi:hypothetical protein